MTKSISTLVTPHGTSLNDILHKVVNNLDIWRSVLYSVVLGGIAINNFQFLSNINDYLLFILACSLTIFESINRYLYRDFTLKEIESNHPNPKEELRFVFIIFVIEITALFSLCFGINGLGQLRHYRYFIIYFLCNWIINLYEFKKLYKKLKKENTQLHIMNAIKKILEGKTEYFYFGNYKEKDKNGNEANVVFKKISFYSEQYLAYNTLLFSAFLAMFLYFYDYFHSIHWLQSTELIILFGSIILIGSLTIKTKRSVLTSLLLLVAYWFLFFSLTAISESRQFFILCCLSHYFLVSICYLRLYIYEIFERIPNLKNTI